MIKNDSGKNSENGYLMVRFKKVFKKRSENCLRLAICSCINAVFSLHFVCFSLAVLQLDPKQLGAHQRSRSAGFVVLNYVKSNAVTSEQVSDLHALPLLCRNVSECAPVHYNELISVSGNFYVAMVFHINIDTKGCDTSYLIQVI